jgi:predicted transcriptional regulator
MAIVIELPESIQEKLRAWAETANQSEEQVVCAALEAYLAVPWPLREEMQAWQTAGAEAIEKIAPIAHEALP